MSQTHPGTGESAQPGGIRLMGLSPASGPYLAILPCFRHFASPFGHNIVFTVVWRGAPPRTRQICRGIVSLEFAVRQNPSQLATMAVGKNKRLSKGKKGGKKKQYVVVFVVANAPAPQTPSPSRGLAVSHLAPSRSALCLSSLLAPRTHDPFAARTLPRCAGRTRSRRRTGTTSRRRPCSTSRTWARPW